MIKAKNLVKGKYFRKEYRIPAGQRECLKGRSGKLHTRKVFDRRPDFLSQEISVVLITCTIFEREAANISEALVLFEGPEPGKAF